MYSVIPLFHYSIFCILQAPSTNTYLHTYVCTNVKISKFTLGTQYVKLKICTVFHSNFTSLTSQVQIHVVLMYTCSILIEHNITVGQLQLCQHLKLKLLLATHSYYTHYQVM